MPLCLAFINFKKTFNRVETGAIVKALDSQGVPYLYKKIHREVRQGETIPPKISSATLKNAMRGLEWDGMGVDNFTTGISTFYKNIITDVKRGVRQGDTISPKTFTATLENAIRRLEWGDMEAKVDGRQLYLLRFADDIVLTTPSISQAEGMLTEFDETCGCIGFQLNLNKTMFK
ncbi:hypothetical protein RB195_016177 [Necator americanus]|uniref:Reverse transcriptase domain-containing protein n=1 Tax=Necator americanus TaxID=51031 RepID=A0ABR1E811_NECAM